MSTTRVSSVMASSSSFIRFRSTSRQASRSSSPPKRRVSGAIRLDYPVANIEKSRTAARSLGGDIDVAPPEWADRTANFFFGYDPEGNQFGVRQQT